MTTLKETFQQLTANYTSRQDLIEKLWREIYHSYTAEGRHYHTLAHLENMFLELQLVRPEFKDWDAVFFALFYHDIVYFPTDTGNEEKSAGVAAARLSELALPAGKIEKCKTIILATKSHSESTCSDINYFTDADLSILGQDWKIYLCYIRDLRKEYSSYPDLIFRAGRKTVLNHFLGRSTIYKTPFFIAKFEKKARKNLAREMTML